MVTFMDENGYKEGHQYETAKDFKLIVKVAKVDFGRFVKLIIDEKKDHQTSIYFNERISECD